MKTCRRGHPYTPENTYVSPMKGRYGTKLQCRTCRRMQMSKRTEAPMTSLTERQLRSLRDAWVDGVPVLDLANRFGVPALEIGGLCRGLARGAA